MDDYDFISPISKRIFVVAAGWEPLKWVPEFEYEMPKREDFLSIYYFLFGNSTGQTGVITHPSDGGDSLNSAMNDVMNDITRCMVKQETPNV